MYYTDSHEWINEVGNPRRCGISTFGQQELGEVVYVELPEIGQEVVKGQEVVVLESTKAAVDLYAPLSGVVVKVNERLEKNPSLVNTDPEGAGWLYELDEVDPCDQEGLMTERAYRELIKKEKKVES